jgi:hypothetical protein
MARFVTGLDLVRLLCSALSTYRPASPVDHSQYLTSRTESNHRHPTWNSEQGNRMKSLHRKPLLSWLLLAPLPTVVVQATIPGTGVIDQGARHVPDDIWLSVFQTPNATGSVSIPGFNMTEQYPGMRSDDWRYTLQIVADVPRHEDDGGFLTGGWVRLEPPQNLLRDLGNGSSVIDQDASWHVCQYVWVADKMSRGTKVNEDTCEGAFPKECYDAILRGMQGRGPGGSCPSVMVLDECREAFSIGEAGSDYRGFGLSKPLSCVASPWVAKLTH